MWQIFLRGYKKNSKVIVSGEFDDMTFESTKEFQKDCKLIADGIVGNKTYEAAKIKGFSEIQKEDWPQPPASRSITSSDRIKLFGCFQYEAAPTKFNPEAIKILGGWDKNNITSIEVPQLAGVTGMGKSSKIDAHKAVAHQIIDLFQTWDDQGLKNRIISWGGSWAPRFIRGSRTSLSNHAWGTAFDINFQWNALGVKPAQLGEKGCVRELVEIAYEKGFYWGGWFPNRPDGMHFEAYTIK